MKCAGQLFNVSKFQEELCYPFCHLPLAQHMGVVIVVMWHVPTMTHQRPQNMAHLGIVQKCFVFYIQRMTGTLFRLINKHNNCFEECVTNPLTHVSNSHHDAFTCIHGKVSIGFGLKHNYCSVLGGQLMQSADHWLIHFIINNISSVCVGVSQIARTVYMLPLIRSKWPGWENIHKWMVGVIYQCCK